jgi:hypothetical protein
MVNLSQLLLPIVLSAVLVFIASALIWMMLPYHRKDVLGTPDEKSLVEALRKQNLAPGQYSIPFCADPAERKTPEFQKKMADGPVAMITIMAANPMNMGPMLAKWFILALVLSASVAYVTGRTMGAGSSYLSVFRVAGTVAFLAYGGAHAIYAIFWGRPWRAVWFDIFDALIYGSLTAGAFGWLWPHA